MRCTLFVVSFALCILNCFFSVKQPHRPRNEGGGGGGGRHKKRVRQPHNTRERQRQLAVGHGEYIMPTQAVQYRAPHNVQPDDALLGMVMTDPRPPRPNSIELRRSYPPEEQHLYSPPSSDHYRWKYRNDIIIII